MVNQAGQASSIRPLQVARAPQARNKMRTLITLTLCAAAAGPLAAPAVAQSQADDAFWHSVFTDNHVLDIGITVTREAWDAMQPQRKRGRRDDDEQRRGSPYSYIKASISIDGEAFEDAGLRFKGNSSFRSSRRSLKKPFKIDLNRFVKGQKLHGRTKLNLSNAFLDPAFMKEKLGYEVYRAAGLPTPGVGWANLTLTVPGLADALRLGIYVIVEQVDQRFLESNLGKASKGSLLMKPEVEDWHYINDDPQAYRRYNIKSGEDNTDQLRAFATLLELIEQAPDAEFEQEIGERMDLEQFAGYLAATSILANVDSYVGMPHNYYLVMDKADGKLRMLPWDVNESFGTFTMPADAEQLTQWDIDRPWIGRRRLLERLFATEDFPQIYRSALEQLMERTFTEDRLFKRIAQLEEVLSPYLGKGEHGLGMEGLRLGLDGDTAELRRAVGRAILGIKPFALKRIDSVKAQLAGEREGQKLGRRRRK